MQAAIEQLPNWDDMSEEDKALFTTVIEASCSIHAICNIATAQNKELARCEKLLRKMKPEQVAKMTEAELDLKSTRPSLMSHKKVWEFLVGWMLRSGKNAPDPGNICENICRSTSPHGRGGKKYL